MGFFIVLIFILGVIDYLYINRGSRNQKIVFISFSIVRISLLIYQCNGGNVPLSGSDYGVFHAVALGLLSKEQSPFLLLFTKSSDYYTNIVAIVYRLFGVNIKLMFAFSYVMSELLFIVIYKIGLLLSEDENVGRNACLIFYVLPIEMVFSLAYLREMTMQLGGGLSFYYFVKYLKSSKFKYIVFAFAFVVIVSLMHSGMIALLLGYLCSFIFYKRDSKVISFSWTKIIVLSLLCIILFSTGLLGEIFPRFGRVDDLNDIFGAAGTGGANTSYISAPSNVFMAILQALPRLFLFLVTPLPWQINSFSILLTFLLDSTIRFYLIYVVYKNIIKTKERKDDFNKNLFYLFIIVWLVFEFCFCWGTNNFGTGIRHRIKIAPVEIVISYVFYTIFNRKEQTPCDS